jgi:SAM-dependent methyltransferase
MNRKKQEEELKRSVRNEYGKIARGGGSCCDLSASCCGLPQDPCQQAQWVGYRKEDLQMAPAGSYLGLGCGNPLALASLREGETVLDLGSGAGIDCFLAASRVGEGGKVIGVDMTPEMVERARENARRGRYRNVEFRLGEMENLPLADRSVDVVISNCAINLSFDKGRVFREAYRVLRPGGRLMVSDLVLLRDLPPEIKESVEAYVGCIAGAISKEEYLEAIRAAGFQEVELLEERSFFPERETEEGEVVPFLPGKEGCGLDPGILARSMLSVSIQARRPE